MKQKYNGGYIAILIMIITGVIIVILMLQQYKSSGLIKQQDSTDNTTPIESAQNIKDVLEKRDKGMLNN